VYGVLLGKLIEEIVEIIQKIFEIIVMMIEVDGKTAVSKIDTGITVSAHRG